MPDIEPEEIEVTALIERMDALEKENSAQKEKIALLESTVNTLGAGLDRIAELLARR